MPLPGKWSIICTTTYDACIQDPDQRRRQSRRKQTGVQAFRTSCGGHATVCLSNPEANFLSGERAAQRQGAVTISEWQHSIMALILEEPATR